MKHPNPNMLLRIAQGDAYGIAREYVKTADHPAHVAAVRRVERYLPNPRYPELVPGMYTDDTQMSVAVTETLLDRPATSPRAFLVHFYNTFKRDPRKGYSRAFQRILEDATSADDLGRRIIPVSTSNGGAMRAVPIGVLDDPKAVWRVACRQAHVTHAGNGITAAGHVALMSHFALHTDEPFSKLFQWLFRQDMNATLFDRPWSGPVQDRGMGVGIATAHAVFTLLTTETSLMGILHRALAWGGDTDSVCAIAWGIASARYKDEELPAFLETDLENGPFGRDYLKTLGAQLMNRYETSAGSPTTSE